jgi:hypothetical protein
MSAPYDGESANRVQSFTLRSLRLNDFADDVLSIPELACS